jgi:Cu(I)-responsive transcriptional regulator
MNIGEASAASGVSAKMIRYYESIGLIPAARRSENGYRVYGESDAHTLRFIHRARALGFPVARIAALLRLWQDKSRTSAEVKAIAEGHVAELQAKIDELQAMVRTLGHLAGSCHGDERPDCPILDDLAGR